MDTPVTLSPEQQRFIESIGLYFEQYGLARIGGRFLGLLLLTDRPLTLDQMATALGVSRASISTNARHTVTAGLAEHISLPGDRRDYYRFAENPWQHAIEVRITGTQALQRIAARGLATLAADDHAARLHLEELFDFCAFTLDDMRDLLARWAARRAAKSAVSSTPQSAGSPPPLPPAPPRPPTGD